MDHRQTAVNTKIVATIGPASESPEMLEKLANAGADVFRLNFAHGEWDWHTTVTRRIRELGAKLTKPLAILQDLGGPKLRLGDLPDGGLHLGPGDRLRFVRQPGGLLGELTCTYPELADELAVGDT